MTALKRARPPRQRSSFEYLSARFLISSGASARVGQPPTDVGALYFFSWATAASAAWNPILLWVPSQKGLLTEAPHRQSANRGPRALVSTLLPLTSTNSRSPSTRYGPLGRMVTLTAIEPSFIGMRSACTIP